jgi:hypothetical protein
LKKNKLFCFCKVYISNVFAAVPCKQRVLL